MDIKSITKIVTDPFTNEEQKRRLVISTLAKDDNIISDVLEILKEERVLKNELLIDMNLELSRAHIFIDSFMPPVPKLKKGEKGEDFSKSFVLDEIAKFYLKYKSMVRHCFNRFN